MSGTASKSGQHVAGASACLKCQTPAHDVGILDGAGNGDKEENPHRP
jgi:hypothetical protein